VSIEEEEMQEPDVSPQGDDKKKLDKKIMNVIKLSGSGAKPVPKMRTVLHRTVRKCVRQYPLPLWLILACDGFWDVCGRERKSYFYLFIY
jgi:hypothetical protein